MAIVKGGQFSNYDEGKYSVSRVAADFVRQGEWRKATAFVMQPNGGYADHLGFKFVGIIPALIEHFFPPNDRIPAYFFSIFSILSVLLLASIAYRLSNLRIVYYSVLAASALSATLFIYARYVFPYDVSLCFALLALWVGVYKPSSLGRSYWVGVISFWSFFCYFGYWQLAGTVMLLHVLWIDGSILNRLVRALVVGLGFGSLFLLLYALGQLSHEDIVRNAFEITKHQSFGWNDFRAGINVWAYFFYAEGLAIFVWVILGGVALKSAAWRRPLRELIDAPIILVAVGFFFIYGLFILDSDLRHHLVVHGRHSRQLVVFLILGFGLGFSELIKKCRASIATPLVFAALLLNACYMLWLPLSIEFPQDFKAKAEKIIDSRPLSKDGKSYYRLVNVDNFVFEPETLNREPLETLLVAKHPYQYIPTLYEGDSRATRNLRLSVDHRMRLVRMGVLENEQLKGETFGMVSMELTFPSRRGGFSEPLLSVGPRNHGALFFVRYVTENTAVIGFENIGVTVLMSEPFEFVSDKKVRLTFFCGSLGSPDTSKMSPAEVAKLEVFRQIVYAKIDQHELINEVVDQRELIKQFQIGRNSLPPEVYVGANAVGAGSAGWQFSGLVNNVVRGGYPPMPSEFSQNQEYGPVRVRFIAPERSNGTAEPLMVAGRSGRAVLGFMRISPNGTVRFGTEIWGVGAFESEPVTIKINEINEIEFSFGSLFPQIGAPAWGDIPREEQEKLKRTLRMRINGRTILEIEKSTPEF
ncbi:MAG TPA: hypothetical protein VKC60_10840, partial [Opitutaceae bacterium]|nr:hypothetical protein [Opitutaceae bacterium]